MSYFDKFAHRGIPFMENRESGKMSDILNKVLHIEDYGWLTDDDGEQYPVIAFREDKKRFYFGGLALGEMLSQVDTDGMRDEVLKVGIKLSERTSRKAHRKYVGFDIIEE